MKIRTRVSDGEFESMYQLERHCGFKTGFAVGIEPIGSSQRKHVNFRAGRIGSLDYVRCRIDTHQLTARVTKNDDRFFSGPNTAFFRLIRRVGAWRTRGKTVRDQREGRIRGVG